MEQILLNPPKPKSKRQMAAQELLDRRRARKSLTRFCEYTFKGYVSQWFHELIDQHLEQVSRGEIQNLMIFTPPRHGKSEKVNIRWPAWDLGANPQGHFISTSYGDELARTFSRACRNVIRNFRYQRLWPREFKHESDSRWQLAEVENERDSYISSGILGTITGEGATKTIIDDPVKNAEEAYSKKLRDKIWDNYTTVVRTRSQPGGSSVLVMTRWHHDDLAGRLLDLAKKNPKADQWIVICLAATNDSGEESYIWNTATGEKKYLQAYSALWPSAFPREELEKRKIALGPVFWDALYMQRPSVAAGQIFKRENWGTFDAEPNLSRLVQVWDTAYAEGQENDYSASITLGLSSGTFPVLDAWRDKVAFPDLVREVYRRWEDSLRLYGRYPDTLLIEGKGSGISLIQQIEANNIDPEWPGARIPVLPMPANVQKVVRAHGISGYQAAKLVLLPRSAEWKEDFVDEHAIFDKGPHDDWVDCLVHGITYYTREVKGNENEEVIYDDTNIVISADLDQLEGMYL